MSETRDLDELDKIDSILGYAVKNNKSGEYLKILHLPADDNGGCEWTEDINLAACWVNSRFAFAVCEFWNITDSTFCYPTEIGLKGKDIVETGVNGKEYVEWLADQDKVMSGIVKGLEGLNKIQEQFILEHDLEHELSDPTATEFPNEEDWDNAVKEHEYLNPPLFTNFGSNNDKDKGEPN